MTLTLPFGIDVSKWQANKEGTLRMDWNKAVANGIQFAFCRATYGAYYIDPQFDYNWAEMKRLNIKRGAYHYYLPTHPLSQIEMFVDLVEPQAGERLVLDFEYSGNLPKDVLTDKVCEAIELVKSLTGHYPIGYSRASWMNANLDMSAIPKIDWWLAQYLKPLIWPLFTPEYDTQYMDIPIGVTREQVKFHQTGERGNGKLYGAQSYYIDTDRFLGTADELTAYFGHTHNVYLPIVIVPSPEPKPVLFQVKVFASKLIIRDAPAGKDTEDRVSEGDVKDVFEISGDWYRIALGWISALWVNRLDTQPVPDVLAVPAFSQRDPRWAGIRLGTSGTTIGWNGCLISCIAMTLKFYGFDYTPATLNTYLTEHNGYDQGNLLWWNRVPHLQIATWIDCLKIPAPLDKIDAELAQGRPCIVHVDFIPSTNVINDHYVIIKGKLGADDYVICDPFDGYAGSFKARYVNPERFIYRIVSYRRNT